jgi:hypothetical protein
MVLRNELFALAKTSYIDPTSVLEREYTNNDTIYLLRNDQNELIAFFMTGLHNFEGKEINYLGLACTNEKYKNSGIILRLLMEFVKNSISRCLPKLCWLTTPSPEIYKLVRRVLDNVNPTETFNFSQESYELAKNICMAKKFHHDYDNPFVLRATARSTRYSLKENERTSIHKTNNVKRLFESLMINEKDGDRLIMLCETPSIQKVNNLRQKLDWQ